MTDLAKCKQKMITNFKYLIAYIRNRYLNMIINNKKNAYFKFEIFTKLVKPNNLELDILKRRNLEVCILSNSVNKFNFIILNDFW